MIQRSRETRVHNLWSRNWHLQSYLGTCRFQNSSKPVLVAFWWEKNVSALGACLGLVALVRTCMSHEATPQEKTLYCLVLLDSGTRHEFWKELTSTEVPLYFESDIYSFECNEIFSFEKCDTLRTGSSPIWTLVRIKDWHFEQFWERSWVKTCPRFGKREDDWDTECGIYQGCHT